MAPPVLPQADGQHLGQAAFDLRVEVGVGLDAVDHGDVVRFQRVPVQHHRGPLRGLSNGKGLHGGPDGHAHGGLGDAVVGQHASLTFSRPAPVASHGGNDEGQRPPLYKLLRQAPDDGCDVGHAPAAGGDGHAVPRFQAAQVEPPHLPSHSGRNVRHLSRTETLPDPHHLGKSHGHSRKTAKDSRFGPQTAQKRRPIYHETAGGGVPAAGPQERRPKQPGLTHNGREGKKSYPRRNTKILEGPRRGWRRLTRVPPKVG